MSCRVHSFGGFFTPILVSPSGSLGYRGMPMPGLHWKQAMQRYVEVRTTPTFSTVGVNLPKSENRISPLPRVEPYYWGGGRPNKILSTPPPRSADLNGPKSPRPRQRQSNQATAVSQIRACCPKCSEHVKDDQTSRLSGVQNGFRGLIVFTLFS